MKLLQLLLQLSRDQVALIPELDCTCIREGMVVKPLDFVTKGRKGLAQPAVKVRGREYLRIIYGPEYTLPENLSRLKSRGLGAKRSLALREFALGIEALERFVHNEPCAAFTSVSLEFSPWKANPSIRGSSVLRGRSNRWKCWCERRDSNSQTPVSKTGCYSNSHTLALGAQGRI
jgi:PNKP adenylyltransferase domain, ligase domain